MEKQLNPEQRVAVDTHEGFIVLMAAPGSGKTTVITHRANAILAKGVRPEKFLSLTFTKEGAKEMEVRAGKTKSPVKLFCTFHSWALRFVTAEIRSFAALGYSLRPNPLAAPYEAAKALGQIIRHTPELARKKEAFHDAQSFMSICKRKGLTPQQAELKAEHELEEVYADVYRRYDSALRAKGCMDFDSLIWESSKLLSAREDVRERWRYEYLQLDEAQDTDVVQWKIVELINNGNVFAVGDENQAMYGWRGSEGNLVQAFTSRFPNAIVLPLSTNYRSTPEIVAYSKEVAPVQNETVIRLSTPHASGSAVEFRRYINDTDEAKAIVNGITDLGNTAVLVRTNRQLRAFEDQCGERNIRYKLLGKSGFWGQSEVKDVMAFVQNVCAPTDASTLRILKTPYDGLKYLRQQEAVDLLDSMRMSRFDSSSGGPVPYHRLLLEFRSGDQGQDDIIHNLQGTLIYLRTHARDWPAGNAVRDILDRFQILNYYEDEEAGIDNDPLENIHEVLKIAQTKGTLYDFLRYTQKVHRASLARTGFLTLSTIHQAKGKEWDTVYVAGVNDGMLPHTNGDLEEEKKIYFVAISRPRKKLFISGAGAISSFIKDKVPPENDPLAFETDLFHGFELRSQVAK